MVQPSSSSSSSSSLSSSSAPLAPFLRQEKQKQEKEKQHDRQQQQQEEEDDACCTVSWTSSMADSLSPDNPPAFPGGGVKPDNANDSSPVTTTASAVLSQLNGSGLCIRHSTNEKRSERSLNGNSVNHDDDPNQTTKKEALTSTEENGTCRTEQAISISTATEQPQNGAKRITTTTTTSTTNNNKNHHHHQNGTERQNSEVFLVGDEGEDNSTPDQEDEEEHELQSPTSTATIVVEASNDNGAQRQQFVEQRYQQQQQQQPNDNRVSSAETVASPLLTLNNTSCLMINDVDADDQDAKTLMTAVAAVSKTTEDASSLSFVPHYTVTERLQAISKVWLKRHYYEDDGKTPQYDNCTCWIGFWALLHVTCANFVLMPMRDAIALAVGVEAMPQLTLASTVLALFSSVPIGWLFEAPDPNRRRLWKRMGLTRGETQGTSLALFYRCFALCLLSYAIGFPLLEWLIATLSSATTSTSGSSSSSSSSATSFSEALTAWWEEGIVPDIATLLALCAKVLYIAFFLVVHLMKLHSLSLMWGVTTEAMEYEEAARRRRKTQQQQQQQQQDQQPQPPLPSPTSSSSTTTRLQRLGFIGFGGTLGGVLGSILASSLAQVIKVSGLLVLAAALLEISAELSIELGRIMQKHWVEEQQELLFGSGSNGDLTSLLLQQQQQQGQVAQNGSALSPSSSSTCSSSSPIVAALDTSMRRSVSLGSMKRVASGNSLNRVRSASELAPRGSSSSSTGSVGSASGSSLASLAKSAAEGKKNNNSNAASPPPSSINNNNNGNSNNCNGGGDAVVDQNDNTFFQRLLRGVTTILKSRLLMAIFTYNALFASTNVLLSFQRAELVANRNETTSKEADLAFLANINMASSVAIFALQASGAGPFIATVCGPQGTLSLMPLIRLAGVVALAYWHHTSEGRPPNLFVFLLVDECCKVVNMAVAKPVRESLWRGLSNEARYEAKPIVDTLANRWGGGSAAFLVSTLHRTLDLLSGITSITSTTTSNQEQQQQRTVFGYPPILFLCLIIAAWWAVVSADLGQIRRRIDWELKKRQ